MFDLFKKSKVAVIKTPLYSLADGEVIRIEQVNDSMFSEKMLGDGFSVKPITNDVFSPGTGVVTNIFPTKHAIGIRLENKIEILVHMGIDTVELQGNPYHINVKVGDKVTKDTLLGTMNIQEIIDAGKETDLIVVFPELKVDDSFTLNLTGNQKHGTKIGSVKAVYQK